MDLRYDFLVTTCFLFTLKSAEFAPLYDCSIPSFLEAVYIGDESIQGFHVNDKVELECKDEFKEGLTYSICTSSGTWSLPNPQCKYARCPDPIEHNHRKLKDHQYKGTQAKIGVGSWIEYECDDGYVYMGTSRLACLRTGEWSNIGGMCKDKKTITCSPPVSGENVLNNYTRQRRGYGDNYTEYCDKGYTYEGVGIRTCQPNGTWSGHQGTCISIICGPPPENRDHWFKRHECKSVCEYGTSITLQCDKGFIYQGDPLRCLGNGSWTKPGHCEPITCRDVPVIENGAINISGNAFMDNALITCDPGFISDNNEFPFCGDDGKWMLPGKCIDVTGESMSMGNGSILAVIGAVLLVVVLVITCIAIRRKKSRREYMPLRATTMKRLRAHSVDLSTQYVNLRTVQVTKGLSEDVSLDKYQRNLNRSDQKDIGIIEILDAAGTEYPLILIQGRAGVGKTTLVKKYQHLWVQNKLKKFRLVLLLDLKGIPLRSEDKYTMLEFLERFSYYPVKKVDNSFLDKEGDSLLLFMDGLDELPDLLQNVNRTQNQSSQENTLPYDWCINILKRNVLQKCTLVVTTRHLKGLHLLNAQSTIEVVGLTKEAVAEYIDKNVKKNRKLVKDRLMKNPHLLSVSTITYFCMRLCNALQDSDIDKDLSDLDTYSRIIVFLLKNYLVRDLTYSRSIQTVVFPQMRELSLLAYNGIIGGDEERTQTILSFHDDDLKDAGIDFNQLMSSRAASALVSTYPDSDSESRQPELLQFSHLSIQELLAMFHMVTSEDKSTVISVLKKMWVSTKFSMAQLFLCGLLFDGELKRLLNIDIEDSDLEFILDGIDRIIEEHAPQGSDQEKQHQFLRAVQMCYESQSPDLAKKVGRTLCASRDKITFSGLTLTAVDINGIAFLVNEIGTIHCLELHRIDMDEATVEGLASCLDSESHLEEIDLRFNVMDDSIFTTVGRLLKHDCPLKILRINNSKGKTTNTGMQDLTRNLKKNKHLQTLCLDIPHIDSQEIMGFSEDLVSTLRLNREIKLEFSEQRNTPKDVIEKLNEIKTSWNGRIKILNSP